LSNAYITRVPQINKLFFPWNRPRKRKLPIGSNSTRRLLRQSSEL
jgi:hypothetical protein